MSFKVIDGGGPGKEEQDRERDREWAKHDFSWAIRDAAANLLRIVRGAGKPYELLAQMKKTIDTAVRFQEVHNHWPSDIIANDLLIENEMEKLLERGRAGTLDKATIDRWWKDGTFDRMMAEHTMYRGALQIIASGLIGQNTQQRAGDSEFHEGLRCMERVRDERLKKFREEQRTSRTAARRPAHKKQKLGARKPPEDVVL